MAIKMRHCGTHFKAALKWHLPPNDEHSELIGQLIMIGECPLCKQRVYQWAGMFKLGHYTAKVDIPPEEVEHWKERVDGALKALPTYEDTRFLTFPSNRQWPSTPLSVLLKR